MKRFIALLIAFSPTIGFAQELDHCVAVYETATRNLQISEASYSSLNTVFDQYCESNGEFKDSAKSGGLEAVIKSVPISLSGNASSIEERFQNFCSNYSGIRYNSAASRALADTVVVDALNAFNNCIEISSRGVIISHSSPTGLDGTFNFTFRANINYELQGVQEGRNIECEIRDPLDGKMIQADTSTTLKFDKPFSAFCKRKPEGSPSGKFFPRTSVVFASNQGNYSVLYPAEEVLDVEFASVLDRRISNAEDRLIALSNNLETNIVKLEERVNDVSSASSALVSELRTAIDFKVFKVLRADSQPGERDYAHVGCADPTAWVQSQCPGYSVEMIVLSSRSGGHCGFTHYLGICKRK